MAGLSHPVAALRPAGQPVRTINNLEEMRWDPQAANILWGFREFSIIQLNVETGAETLIKDFAADPAISSILLANPGIYHITCMNEGASSRDKRFWALALQNGDDPVHPEWSSILINSCLPGTAPAEQVRGGFLPSAGTYVNSRQENRPDFLVV